MTSLDGIADLHMSGARAVFQLSPGADLSEMEVAKAFEDNGMKLESFERVERPLAKGKYTVDSGIT
ncbi:MAG: hypothetical protein AAF682_11035 [Planctomycetota bacterium]